MSDFPYSAAYSPPAPACELMLIETCGVSETPQVWGGNRRRRASALPNLDRLITPPEEVRDDRRAAAADVLRHANFFRSMLQSDIIGLSRQGPIGLMPTVLRVGRYRFAFFSNENQEAPHVHVKADNNQAKFWLDPIELASNYGFKAHELNEIERIIRQHQKELLEAWYEHFS